MDDKTVWLYQNVFNFFRGMMMKKTLTSLAVMAAFGLVSVSASAVVFVWDDFKVNEGAVLGAYSQIVTANNFSGSYDEFFKPTGSGTFSTTAYWQASTLNYGMTNVGQVSQHSPSIPNDGYNVYAVFTSLGTFTQSGTVTNFHGISGQFDFYTDELQDTVRSFDLTGLLTLTSTSDDKKVGTSTTLIAAEGEIDSGSIAAGNFDFIFDVMDLTDPYGKLYFNGTTLKFSTDVQGNVNDFDPLTGGYLKQSSANVELGHIVPEPGSMALLGLGLAGLGFVKRRRKLVQ